MFSTNTEFESTVRNAERKETTAVERYTQQCFMLSDLSMMIGNSVEDTLDQLYDLMYNNFMDDIDTSFSYLLGAMYISKTTITSNVSSYKLQIQLDKIIPQSKNLLIRGIQSKRDRLMGMKMTIRDSVKLISEYDRYLIYAESQFISLFDSSYSTIEEYTGRIRDLIHEYELRSKNIMTEYDANTTITTVQESLETTRLLMRNISSTLSTISDTEFKIVNRLYRLIVEEDDCNRVHMAFLFSKSIIVYTHQLMMLVAYEPFMILKDVNNTISPRR